MPKQATNTATSGGLEIIEVMLLSAAAKLFGEKKLADAIVFILPDTGQAKFKPAGVNAQGKETKATFIVAELGSSFAGEVIGLVQGTGDVDSLPLAVKINVIAQPPNTKGKTVDEALNRPVKPIAAVPEPKTGTNN